VWCLAAAAGLVLGAAPALAQVVTPPPAEAPKIDAHIPKAPPPPPAPPPRPIPARPAKPAVEPLPNLPYTSLVERDASGKMRPLSEPAELAALRRNPLVQPEVLAEIQPYLAERRATYERLVIENLDLVEKLTDGTFDAIDYSGKEGFALVVQTVDPIRKASPRPLAEELAARELIDAQAVRFNEKITKEYNLASLPGAKAGATPAERAQHAKVSLAGLYRAGVNEAAIVHRDLLLEASRSLDRTLPEIVTDEAVRRPLLAAAPGAGADDEARVAAVRRVNAALTIDQRRDLLRRAIALRAK